MLQAPRGKCIKVKVATDLGALDSFVPHCDDSECLPSQEALCPGGDITTLEVLQVPWVGLGGEGGTCEEEYELDRSNVQQLELDCMGFVCSLHLNQGVDY